MNRAECLRELGCVLDKAPGAAPKEYRCRDAASPCERLAPQSSGELERLCREAAGCKFHPETNYCACRGNGVTLVPDGPEAEPCVCESSGGLPAHCTAAAP